ncbi:MAG: hypothetical protein NT157_00425, partial [Candidatus Micrarchaeota archaeon]|nr:hypothetical protein [Candidatus Micrarchaeota archaeon]
MSPDAKSKHVAAALIILSILYVAEVPYLSLLARLLFHTLLLGYLARKPLGLGKSRWVLFESILLSIAVTTCAGMLAGVYLPVAGLASSLLMLAVAWALFLRFGFEKPAIPAEYLNFALIFLFASVPLAIMLLLNPYAGFISDGWWHCPVLNTIRYDGLPPQNPWLSGATLAYPYAYHVFLSYAFGGGLFCLDQFGIFAVLLMFAQALGIYCILAEFGGKKIGKLEALAGSFVFTWASTIGGLFFAWDAITKIPAIGISGFMEFMKTNHGPHMWYGAMKLLFPSGLNIPFQGMAMVGSPQFLLLVGILYFLLKKSEMVGYGIKKSDIGVALCLAPLCAVSPVVGLIAAIALSLFILYERGLAGVAAIGAVGIATFLIDVSYILAVLGKPAVGGGVIGLSPDALPTLLLAAFGISPLLVFAFLGAKEIDAKVRA